MPTNQRTKSHGISVSCLNHDTLARLSDYYILPVFAIVYMNLDLPIDSNESQACQVVSMASAYMIRGVAYSVGQFDLERRHFFEPFQPRA